MPNGMTAEEFGARLDTFFEKLPDEGEYMVACRSGSSKRTSVQTRFQIMNEILKDEYDFATRPENQLDEHSLKNRIKETVDENAKPKRGRKKKTSVS